MRLAIVLAAAVAAIFAAVSLAATRSAHVGLASTAPVVVSGAGFKAHEHVKVTVSAKTTRSKLLVAGSAGGFRTTFTGFMIPRCVAYVVTAKGNRGSSAVVKITPECAPARTATSPDSLLPQDPGAPKKPH